MNPKSTHAVLALAACLLAGGCALPQPRDLTLGPSYRPQNVFVPVPALPPSIKRVAVLPLLVSGDSSTLLEGRETLEPVLQAELAKTGKFEVFYAGPEFVRSRTGRSSWGGEDALPPEFFVRLHESSGCDAVLFCQLTAFRSYSPLAVGWRLRLVDARTRETLWAADEVFDAGQRQVQAGARRYQLAQLRTTTEDLDEWSVLTSPRQFGQYAAAQLVATLPSP